jgi:hypothetical protein
VGVAPSGSPSNSIFTGSAKHPENHVKGHGAKEIIAHHVNEQYEDHPNTVKLRDHLTSLLDPHVYQVHGPVVTIEDANSLLSYKKLAVDGNMLTNRMQVWTGHHSPKHFKVTAEVIVTDPPLAERKLTNARAVRGRIALVERYGKDVVDDDDDEDTRFFNAYAVYSSLFLTSFIFSPLLLFFVCVCNTLLTEVPCHWLKKCSWFKQQVASV